MAFSKRKLPPVIGAEASGVVEALGQGTSGLIPGQLVSIYGARTCGLCRPCRVKRDNLCEHVGGDTWAGSMLCLKRGGRLVTCGSTSGVSTEINLMMLFQQQLRLIGSFGRRMENMANAMQKMAAGPVSPVIDTEARLDTIHHALERMEGRDVFGKIILRMD